MLRYCCCCCCCSNTVAVTLLPYSAQFDTVRAYLLKIYNSLLVEKVNLLSFESQYYQ